MDRRKNGEEHSQLLNDSAFSESEKDYYHPEDNSGFNENFDEDHLNGNACNGDEDDEEIVLRNKVPDSEEIWSPLEGQRRYAEVFRCSYPPENSRKRWSGHTDARIHSYNLACAGDNFSDDVGCDETQILLPKSSDSQEEIDHSRGSFVSHTGELAEDEESSVDSDNSMSSSPHCPLSLGERLLATHPVWFLRGMQRAGAVHLLQGKEEGNFIVRASSQRETTMAISVRLPEPGPYIEHYLILARDGALSLESSRFKFESMPSLIEHYCQCCDELPVQLTLPRALMEINNRQQLSSLALLGQEFWQRSMLSPKSPDPSTLKSPLSGTSGIFSGLQTTLTEKNEIHTPASDTTISSFVNGQALASPMSIDDSVMSPTSASSQEFSTNSGIIGKTSTFKVPSRKAATSSSDRRSSVDSSEHSQSSNPMTNIAAELATRTRPAPPNTLNLQQKPAPPPRWSKILLAPPNVEQAKIDSKNFTVITTVTFSVDNNVQGPMQQQQQPQLKNPFNTAKRLSPEGHASDGDLRPIEQQQQQQEKKVSDSSQKNHRRSKRKESKHYQESDILESVYCRSTVQDKISDYEDLWGNDAINSPIGKSVMSSFRSSASACSPRIQETAHKKSQLILTPVELPMTSTNPFASKLHHSSSNLHTMQTPNEFRTGFVRQAANRLSLDLSPEVFKPSAKDWSPFYSDPVDTLDEFDETTYRRHGNDTLKRAQEEGKRKGIALDPWIADTSWEYVMQNLTLRGSTKHPIAGKPPSGNMAGGSGDIRLSSKPSALHQLIASKAPELHVDELLLPHIQVEEEVTENGSDKTLTRHNRVSSYDNVERQLYASSTTYSDEGTVFSEPWDNSPWEKMIPERSSATIKFSKCKSALGSSDDNTDSFSTNSFGRQFSRTATITRNRSYRDKGILCHPQNRTSGSPGELVETYALELARNHASTFSKNIENFIACTKESTETAPQVVMRNMRQFMSGMKNYLVKHGEADFQREVKRASSRLKPDEFLNLDTILEGVMHRLVVLPLKQHLYNLSVDFYTHSGDLRNLIDNIRLASTKTLIDFGIQKNVSTPTAMELRHISLLFHRMQEADLPLEKLDLLLTVVSCVFDTSKVSRNQLSADDFLPLLIYTVANCGFIGAEIEAEYMWGLLHPSLLNGEAGYYLTALCSAVQMLKNFTTAFDIESPESADSSTSDAVAAAAAGTAPSCTLRSSVLKVIIPDEYNGSLQKRTLPVRPNTTTKDLCRIIAHKAGITNPQDYGLFKLVNGEETLLQDNEYPQEVAILSRNKSCAFAYKRIDAKIAWPDEFF